MHEINTSIAKDLQSLLQIINRSNQILIKNVNSSISKAINTCRKSNEIWSYDIKDIIFEDICLDKIRRPKYISSDLAEISLKLSITIKGDYKKDTIHDPLKKLNINFVLSGVLCPKNSDKEIAIMNTWHLDRDGDDNLDPSFIHPKYHINFGGMNMNKSELDFGSLLLLDTPRITHLPMDIVLAIDFVLKNFYTDKKHRSITSKPEYKKLLKNAQERFWKPYIHCLASQWGNTMNDTIDPNFKPKQLLPNLVTFKQ